MSLFKENFMTVNPQILLDNRPTGEAVASNFKLVSSETPALQDGQVLVRHHFLSLDRPHERFQKLHRAPATGTSHARRHRR